MADLSRKMRRRRRRLFGMFCVFLLLKIFQRSVCRRLHQTADADQNIDAFSDGVNADFAVHLFFVFSEFKHISEYCCFASICKGKNIERRFHRGRDGLVPSGGGASLVLESYESAVRRGATILAEVIGYGFSSNGDHISVPNVDGPRRSLQMAINDAGIPLEEIQYINAHATSTPVGDLNEAKAIAEVFGNHRPYVTSTKSQTGHEMWMAGASEVIYSILMMNNGFIAPNLNFEEPDEASALLNIPSRRIETEFDTFLSNSFGFGGTNSSLIIRKFKENN